MGDREPKADEILYLARVFGVPEPERPEEADRLDHLLQAVETILAQLEEERRRAAAREEVLPARVAAALDPKARQAAAEQLRRVDARPARPS
jgi:hypothetical protein